MNKTVKVTISGKVQGVGFRSWTIRWAKKLDISGWVRNKSDGTVEALFSGEEKDIGEMIRKCYHGPANSLVEDVKAITATEETQPGFLQKPTE